MSSITRPGYVGGYVDPQIKLLFVRKAEEQGVNQTDLLNAILEDYFGVSNNYSTLSTEEIEDFLNEDSLEWDKIGPLLRKELSCLILAADAEVTEDADDEDENPLYVPQVLEVLADMLLENSGKPLAYDCTDGDKFEEVLPDELTNELITIVARSIREVYGTGYRKENLFIEISNFLNQRADVLYVDARRVTMKFSREEWFYLDRLVEKVNAEKETQFSELPELLHYTLGEQLEEYAGNGFWGTKDEGMVKMGMNFKSRNNQKV